ncbi:MAG: mechanosensitive ion channel domain-containing protein [Saprospiraceae bacterium]
MKELLQGLSGIIKEWENAIISTLPNIVLGILVFFTFYILAKIIRNIILRTYTGTIHLHPNISSIIAASVYYFLIFSGVFLSMQVVGLEKILANILAGAGIIGIIAGFAFKDIASNIFAGLLLKLQRPYKKGDWVNISTVYGMVENVGWITTTIKPVEGQDVIVPNQLIYSNVFTNFSTYQQRRVILEMNVSQSNDLDRIKTIALEEVHRIKELLPNETIDFFYTTIGNSTITFQLRFWINFEKDNDFQQATNDIIVQIKNRFELENIVYA